MATLSFQEIRELELRYALDSARQELQIASEEGKPDARTRYKAALAAFARFVHANPMGSW